MWAGLEQYAGLASTQRVQTISRFSWDPYFTQTFEAWKSLSLVLFGVFPGVILATPPCLQFDP